DRKTVEIILSTISPVQSTRWRAAPAAGAMTCNPAVMASNAWTLAAMLTTTDMPITKTKIGSSRVASVNASARSVKNNSAPPAMVAATAMTVHFTHGPFHDRYSHATLVSLETTYRSSTFMVAMHCECWR